MYSPFSNRFALLIAFAISTVHCSGFLLNTLTTTIASAAAREICSSCNPAAPLSSSTTRTRSNTKLAMTTMMEEEGSQQGSNRTDTSLTTDFQQDDAAPAAGGALTLQAKAQALRAEMEMLRNEIEEEKARKLAKQNENIDRWIDDLLVQCTVSDSTQMIKNVDQVVEQLMDGRYSEEQMTKIFNRICDTGPPQSRSKISPLMETFVDAVGKMDCVEWEDNPNKRWSGVVERKLRKKLFHMDFQYRLDEDYDD